MDPLTFQKFPSFTVEAQTMSLYEKRKTAKIARNYLAKRDEGFRNLLEKRMQELKPVKFRQKRFELLAGNQRALGKIRSGDLPARKKLGNLLISEISKLRLANPRLVFYHVTLLADEGVMPDRSSYVDFEVMCNKTDKSIRASGYNGIYGFEVQALTNWPQQGAGRTLLGHIHALVWRDRKYDKVSLKFRDLQSGLRGQGKWSCMFGAKPVKVVEITEEMGCPSFWAAYLLKAPDKAKRRVKVDSKGEDWDQFKLKQTTEGYRPELAMRVFELMSQLPLHSVVRGVGDGAAIMRRCRSRLKHWNEKREGSSEALSPNRVARFFSWTHRQRRKQYQRFHIAGPSVD